MNIRGIVTGIGIIGALFIIIGFARRLSGKGGLTSLGIGAIMVAITISIFSQM